MELRLLDEVMPLPVGVGLISMDEARGERLVEKAAAGAILTDALGGTHRVDSVEAQEGLYLLYLPQGDSAYWERLFRKVTVDATLVALTFPEGEKQP